MAAFTSPKPLKVKVGWVSVSRDHKKIVAHAKTLKGLISKLKKMGDPEGSITFIPNQKVTSYIG